MSVDLGHTSGATTACRYPKRKRQPVFYAEPQDDDGLNLDLDSDFSEEGKLSRKKPRRGPPKTKAAPRQKAFPFMSLPPELRNKIYELALTDPNGIHIRSIQGHYRRQAIHCSPQLCLPSPGYARWTHQEWLRSRHGDSTPAPPDHKTALIPALLSTCKAINAEAAPMIYGQPFYVSDMTALQTFLIRLRPSTMAMLRELTIISWCASRSQKAMNLPAFGLLRGASNLEKLHIYDTIGHHGYRISLGPDGDVDRAKHVAKKVYKECFPWLEAVVDAGGLATLKKVFVLNEENFKPSIVQYASSAVTPSWRWTQDRHDQAERLMFDEILRLLKANA